MSASTSKQDASFFRRFSDELTTQRWDDHRYYHQNRINQSLHFFSSISFMTMYVVMFISPSAAAIIGWLLAMLSRQAGHFFFESRDYDHINRATHEHKEDIKVGYNLHRKRILHAVWALVPILFVLDPSFFGMFTPYENFQGFVMNTGLVWAVIGIGALVFRTLHLFLIRDVMTGAVWLTKIVTDPFHDFKIYCKAPLYVMRGEMIDPMTHTFKDTESDKEAEENLANR